MTDIELTEGRPDQCPDPASDETLRELGDYRIIREIGRGGMGVVYEAEQVSLSRRVALKILPTSAVLDKRQLQRFKNEAQAAAMLHHPNIVPIFGVGSDRGVHFFAMHFVDGPTLADIIKELRSRTDLAGRSTDTGAKALESTGKVAQNENAKAQAAPLGDTNASHALARLSTEQSTASPAYFRSVVRLAIQVADALQHAHELGILHRDIKPSNLLFDERGNVWVTDFGLAQVRGDAELTLTGDLVGTLRYMSPEQALAKRIPVDHRTDIYSLGVTLYELVTLTPAVRGADRQEILQRIAFEEPHPPRRVNKRIPVELETIILKATAKNPASRYDSAADLAEDLRNFLDDKPIRARRATIAERAFLWSRRHRTLVGAALLLLVVVAIGSSVAAITIAAARNQAERNAESERLARGEAERQRQGAQAALFREAKARKDESTARTDAERQKEIAQQNFRQARQAVDDFYTKVSQSTLLEAAGLQPLRKELMDAALEYYKSFAAQSNDDPVIRAELAKTYFRVAEITNSTGRAHEAIITLGQAADLIADLSSKYPDRTDWKFALPGVYTGPRFLTNTSFTPADGLAGVRTLQRLIPMYEAFVRDHPDVPGFQSDLAGFLFYYGIVTRSVARPTAIKAFQQAHGIWEQLHVADPKSPFYRCELARICLYSDSYYDVAGAEQLLRQGKQALDELVAESRDVREHRMLLAQTCGSLAGLLRRSNRPDEAEELYRQTVRLGMQLVRESPASYEVSQAARVVSMVAMFFKEQGRNDEAEKTLQQGIDLFTEILDEVPVKAAYRKNLEEQLDQMLKAIEVMRQRAQSDTLPKN